MKLKIMIIIVSVLAGIALSVFLYVWLHPVFGGKASGDRLARMGQSPNYKDGVFQNPVPTPMQTDDMPVGKLLKAFFISDHLKRPQTAIPVLPIDKEKIEKQDSAIQVVWLGHSTVLLNMHGKRILIDPVLGKWASPVPFLGPPAFKYSHNYSLADLPPVDLVLISHDHYDHLEYSTIKKLAKTGVPFITALGIGAHLEKWGVQPEKITELDWHQSSSFFGSLKISATPSRHFSGRGITNRFSTLWASWVIESNGGKVFFGGDSGYFDGFKAIGEEFGPFDLVMLECGQYSQYWPNIHMMPEETAQAAADLQAKALLPIHWGRFQLSIHPWKEPVERVLAKAEAISVNVLLPQIGQTCNLDEPLPKSDWWQKTD